MSVRNRLLGYGFWAGVLMVLTGLGLGTVHPAYAAGRSEATREEVVIGYQTIPNGAMVAKQLGWHEERLGRPVQWVQFNSGSELNAAVAAGSVDIGLGGSSTTVAAIAQGVPARVFFIYDIIGENEALVVRSGSGISEVTDLVGKRVAAPFGATTHYHLLAALGEAEVDPESVTILDMTTGDILAAWQRGDIDAAFVWEPSLAALLELGGDVLITSGELAQLGYLTGDIGIVREGFAARNPELVVRYLETQLRAIALYRQDPEAAAAAVAREFDISESEAARQMAGLQLLSGPEQLGSEYLGTSTAPGALAEVFHATAQFLVEQQTIGRLPEIEVFRNAIDASFLERAVRGLEE